MFLEFIGTKTFSIEGQNYTRNCFVNPSSDKVYCIDTDIAESGNFDITDWNFSKKGLKIKSIKKRG